ncbi:MAG: hypothetical protein DRQ88_10360 [Epsilonproteobacteria bacterium]|nr:MAG: hypothetical protein DRQ88_10360 [Campylobacterota bacterium]RLA65376.1 MAG: hypothetical protein DRQ89_01260 [Campylobacterota bacterium]
MNFQAKYLEIIGQLKKNTRPMVELTPDEVRELWVKELSEEDLKQVLCILDHTKKLHGEFSSPIIKTLAGDHSPEILVYALAASQRHIIAKCGIDGVRVPKEFIEALRKLLKNNDAEVLEWDLRVIEQLGGRALILKEDVLAAKPNFLRALNPHKKAARQIITMLEKRWNI